MQFELFVSTTKIGSNDKTVPHYRLRHRGDWLWLENQDGERMEMSEQDLFDALDAHFKVNF